MNTTVCDILTSTKYRNGPAMLATSEAVTQEVSAPMCSKSIPNSTTESIPYGYCHCGCGEKTRIASSTNSSRGWVKGAPIRYVYGHQSRSAERKPRWNSCDQCWDLPLLKGGIAKVSRQDYEIVRHYSWRESRDGYVIRGSGGHNHFLHREIMGTQGSGRKIHVDHINGDLLDNRRSNLRIATPQQNRVNSHSTRGASGYFGVSWHKKASKWQVLFKVRGKAIYIGVFHCPIEAAVARDIAAIELHGEYASLNFPELREVMK